MFVFGNSFVQRNILFASGMVSKGSMGSGHLDEGFGAILLGTIFGAFCGLIVGLVVSNLIRYVSFLMGRQINGYTWTIACVVAGAALFAWWTAIGNGESAAVTSE